MMNGDAMRHPDVQAILALCARPGAEERAARWPGFSPLERALVVALCRLLATCGASHPQSGGAARP